MASTVLPPQTPDEALAWEQKERPRAAIAAVLAGILTLIGSIATTIVYKDQPTVYLVDGLRDAAGEQVPAGGVGADYIRFLSDHSTGIILVTIISAIGAALMAPALAYLFRASKARQPALPKISLISALVGPILVAVGQLAFFIGHTVRASNAAGGTLTTQAVQDATSGGLLSAGQALYLLGLVMVAAAAIMISLNAMRVGLLTRFMGVLGIIVGVLEVLAVISGGGSGLGQGGFVIQCFWLVALGALIWGFWPNGVPVAWKTGTAQAWPSQQEVREQREAMRRGQQEARGARKAARGAEVVDVTADDEDEPVAAGPAHPSSKKRKRKRR
jgi:hypothetical protein